MTCTGSFGFSFLTSFQSASQPWLRITITQRALKHTNDRSHPPETLIYLVWSEGWALGLLEAS